MKFKLVQIFLNIIAGITSVLAFSTTVNAEIENRLGLRFYGSFLYSETVPNALFFFSDIEKNDSFELRKALRNHDIDILVLSSAGGSVWEGLNMAGIIHDKGLTTYVPKLGLVGNGNCASACSFMFFAGKTREADGTVGVHQFFSNSTSKSVKVEETEEIAQFTVSEIIGFLNEFETPPFVFERMFQQSKMYYFDTREMKQIARSVTPLMQEQRLEIEAFIGKFLVELASIETEESSEAQQKPEPKQSPPPQKQLPQKEPSTITQELVVQKIQTELNRLNCNAGLADGVIGNKTKSALARYATAVGRLIDEAMLKDKTFLTELQKSQVNCETKKTYTTSTLLATNYKFEICGTVENKRECSSGDLQLQRLRDGEYEFEEKPASPEAVYGMIKLKGSEVQLQMVDFIEGTAVPVSTTGKMKKSSREIIFNFKDEYVIKTFKKAGINLVKGELVDLQLRWY